MSNVLNKMLEKTGKSATDFRSNSNIGTMLREKGIRETDEFKRILRLPRREWEQLSEGGYQEKLSEHLRVPGGTRVFRPAQVAVLTEAFDFGGCIGQLGLGEGKTDVSATLATLLGAERPVLLAPAKLRKKTARDFKKLREHWIIHPKIEFISYEMLSRVKQATILDEIAPDLIICDEVQKLKNLKAGCTARVKRYMAKNPSTKFVGLSGTLMNRSLHDFWHLFMWALKPQIMPLPRQHGELNEWALAIDEKIDNEKRVKPGALLLFAPDLDETLPPIERARKGVQLRLRQTPGVVMTKGTGVNASITMELIKPPKSKLIDEALANLRSTWTTPNGVDLSLEIESKRLMHLTIWRYARQLGCGFYYQWTPAAPIDWMLARRNWGRYVRHILSNSNKIDTPLQVTQAVENGFLKTPFKIPDPTKPDNPEAMIAVPPHRLLGVWRDLRDTFKPNPVANWIDDSYLKWLVKTQLQDEPTIIWAEHTAVGEKLAKMTGLPYCNKGGCDAKGRFIEDLSGHVIASVESCGEGTNLQAKWSRNLVISCPPVGKVWEQMIGRTHRSGQEADTVEVLVLAACSEQEEGLEQAIRDARCVDQTMGQEQRLLLADRV